MAAPRSVGPAVFLGSPPTLNTLLVPPGVYGSMAAPRSVGPAAFLGSPPTLNTLLVPPGVYGAMAVPPVWDPRFSWAHRQPSTLWVPPGVYGAMAAPRSVGPAVYSGSPPTLNTLLVPPGAYGSWPLLQCGTRGLLGLTANPQHLKRLERQTSADDVNLKQGFVPGPHPRWGNGHSRAQWNFQTASVVFASHDTDCSFTAPGRDESLNLGRAETIAVLNVPLQISSQFKPSNADQCRPTR